MQPITIICRELRIPDCTSILVVPEKAIAEHGYIKTSMAAPGGQGKHEFQALAQTAYYQYQDDELDIACINDPVQIEQDGEIETLARGMIIFRHGDGAIKVIFHDGLVAKKLLEAAHRYCTRWVRLDI